MWTRILILILLLSATNAPAATYYVSPTGNDAAVCSEALPCQHISVGISKMTSGDTLILADGIYTGDNLSGGTVSNMISVNDYHGRKFPPNGVSSSQYTTIRARNVGQAIIDGQYTSTPFHNGNGEPAQYLWIDGIHFRNGAGVSDPTGGGVFGFNGSHSKITNCGFEDGGPSSDTSQYPIASILSPWEFNTSVLVEDCWAWGRGRYGIYFSGAGAYGQTESVFRRIVVRQDSVPGGPYSGMMFYNGADNHCQNCVIIDSAVNGDLSISYGAFAITSNQEPPTSLNNSVSGSIGLNNEKYSGYFPQNNVDGFTMSNTVLWGNGRNGANLSPSVSGTSTLTNITAGEHRVAGQSSGLGFYRNSGYSGIMTLNNVIAYHNIDAGIQTGQSVTNVDTYGNSTGVVATTVIGLNRTYNPLTSGLTYLPRIEPGSNLATDGLGANILYQIGAGSKMYGETGWNTESTTQLWPFPNEAIWAAKMKAYTASGPGGNRGFAALSGSTATPLTDYIWSYLGTPMTAANIYSGGSVINGSCGTSNNGTFSTAPTTNLCSSGTPSLVTGQYVWTCSGSNGGTTASCSASYSAGSGSGTAAISTATLNCSFK